jgi:hypothetical protein
VDQSISEEPEVCVPGPLSERTSKKGTDILDALLVRSGDIAANR